MHILLTGASSFTGFWFARQLAAAGHHVTACFRGTALGGYVGARRLRVEALTGVVEPVWGLEVGDDRFLNLLKTGSFDLFCHHAAEMVNYRSWDFNALGAAEKNTRGARQILTLLADKGCQRVIMTGSVFEPFEGEGDAEQRAFNPYGLSKHLSFEIYRLEAQRAGVGVDKFVIPNPFGAFEEARFTTYLAKEWKAGRTPYCKTPAYVRDNIPVDLLALAYRAFCEHPLAVTGGARATPSGYVEMQGAFACRVAREYGARAGREIYVELSEQTEFTEPLVRLNGRSAQNDHPQWSPTRFWDEAFEYWNRFDS